MRKYKIFSFSLYMYLDGTMKKRNDRKLLYLVDKKNEKIVCLNFFIMSYNYIRTNFLIVYKNFFNNYKLTN